MTEAVEMAEIVESQLLPLTRLYSILLELVGVNSVGTGFGHHAAPWRV